MALRNSDGSIILPVEVDTSGIPKSIKKIKNAAAEMGNAFERFGQKIKNASNEGSAKIMQLEENSRKAAQAVEEQGKKVDELKQKLQSLEGGKTTPETSEMKSISKDLAKVNSEIETAKSRYNELNAIIDQTHEKYKGVDMPTEEFERIKPIYAEMEMLESKIQSSKEKAKELGTALKTATGQSTQAEISKTKSELEKAEGKLTGLKNNADIARKKLEEMGNKPVKSVNSLAKGIQSFGKRLAGLAKRVFIFSVITAAMRNLRSVISGVVKSDTGFQNSLEALKNSLWVAFTPILNFIIPVLKTLINWLNIVIVYVTKFIAAITGKSYSSMVENAKQLKAQSAGYDDVGASSAGAAKNMKKVTKEAERQMAAFDELNVLSSNDNTPDTSAGGGGGAGGGVSDLGVGKLDSNGVDVVGDISKKLAIIMGIAALSLIAIGLILLFFGQVAWGIGFLIAGASLLAVTMAASSKTDIGSDVIRLLTTIMGIAAGALLALGIIILVLGPEVGSKAVAIGMIVAGAVLLIGSVAALVGFDVATIQNVLALVTGIAGGALLALGIMLCIFKGPDPVNIGLIVAGAVALASSVALNSDKIVKLLKGKIGIIVAIVSAALLVIGVILCFTGVALPLGIGLIAAGAVGLVSVVALNWDKIVDKIRSVKDKILSFLSKALLVLGVILAFSGWGLALGIALIGAGSAAYGKANNLPWDALLKKIREAWEKIQNYFLQKISKYLEGKYWGGVAKDMINAFLMTIFKGLNKLVSKLNSFSFNLPDILGGGHVGFNIAPFEIPQLAKGAVIPPNAPFAAILGDQKRGVNIETPLDTMIEAFLTALDRRGGASDGVIENVIMLDGEVLYKSQKKIQRNKGYSFATGGSW